jgi:hypothetical protein
MTEVATRNFCYHIGLKSSTHVRRFAIASEQNISVQQLPAKGQKT